MARSLRQVPRRVCPECGRLVRVTLSGTFPWHYRPNVSGPGSRCPQREAAPAAVSGESGRSSRVVEVREQQATFRSPLGAPHTARDNPDETPDEKGRS
jgi:hypothetical protein